ncbi:MAG: restriction endonuclease subunit S [Bacteroidales bacterium]|nr:restriction endonuclease subunit S [Bacteroidales bacterium]
MKKYDSYKDSGIEWIGEIPTKWNVKKIKHRCYVKARVGWKGLKSDEFLTEGYSYLVTGSDFKKDTVNWNECYHIDKDRYEEDPYIQLQEEDLLITKDGTIGKLAIVKDLDKPACLNSGIFVVRSTNEDFNTEFLFWILKSKAFIQFNEYTSYGSTIQHLYQNVFVEFAFPFPSPQEQTAIANYLDRKTAEIDELIADKKRLLELYEEEKTAIINQAVTGKTKACLGSKDVKMKDSGIEWLGEIPEHWEVALLKRFCKVTDGSHYSPKTQEEGMPYISVKDIGENTIDLINCKKISIDDFNTLIKNGCSPKEGDILLTKDGTIGRAAIVTAKHDPFVILSSLGLITPNEKLISKYLYYYLISGINIDQMYSFIHGSALTRLTIEKINNLLFTIPPIVEQQSIVNYIETETARIDSKISKTEKLIELLTEYRTALISEVVTGKVKVI